MDDLELTGPEWAQGYPEREDDTATCPRCDQPIDPADFACGACGKDLASLDLGDDPDPLPW